MRPEKDFEAVAAQGGPNLVVELASFVLHNKKWWLVPVLMLLGLFGALVALSGTAAAPFIYTLF